MSAKYGPDFSKRSIGNRLIYAVNLSDWKASLDIELGNNGKSQETILRMESPADEICQLRIMGSIELEAFLELVKLVASDQK